MQDDGKSDGDWTLEITRVCVQCGGSGKFSGSASAGSGQQADCSACVHGKERRALTIEELRHLLAQQDGEPL
jgi:hypothetical protein